MHISRFQDGKVVERWGSSDELGILKQIGVGLATKNPPKKEVHLQFRRQEELHNLSGASDQIIFSCV